MKPSTKDQIKGKLHEMKGTVKGGTGHEQPEPSGRGPKRETRRQSLKESRPD
jgi:hypothetical protein